MIHKTLGTFHGRVEFREILSQARIAEALTDENVLVRGGSESGAPGHLISWDPDFGEGEKSWTPRSLKRSGAKLGPRPQHGVPEPATGRESAVAIIPSVA